MEKPSDTLAVPAPVAPVAASWKDAWQLPALAGSLLLLVGGIVAAFLTAPTPNYGAGLAEAQHLVEAQEYEAAIETLNARVVPFVGSGVFTEDQVREFHLLVARSIAKGQKEKGLDREENNRTITSEFSEVEKLGGKLGPEDVGLLSDALISLGELDKATDRVATIPDDHRDRRIALYMRLIDRALAPPKPEEERAIELLSTLLADPGIGGETRVWALARQTEIALNRGFAEDAIAKLLRTMPRLMHTDSPEVGELFLLLGRAYIETGANDEAAQQLARAAELIPQSSISFAQLQLLLARIDEGRNDLTVAKDRYVFVLANFAETAELMPALLGLAEVSAALEQFDESVEQYTRLVDAMKQGSTSPRATPEIVGRSLMSRFADQMSRNDAATALKFGDLAEALFGIDAAPPEVLVGLAEAHRRLAEEVLPPRRPDEETLVKLAELDPATQAQVRQHLVSSGAYFRAHADRVVVTDSARYAQSLWGAADMFDRAGDLDAARAAFREFVTAFPGDARQAEAKFRMGQAAQTRGDFEEATTLYRELLQADATSDLGPWADASYVPLAQTLLLDGDPKNDAEAERLLQSVVGGAVGGTETPNFRNAVFELGQYYYLTGQHERAIERLEEMVARFPEHNKILGVRYRLADSYRRSAAQIDQRLKEAMPDSQRQELIAKRTDRLRKALVMFEQVRAGLEARDERRRTALEEIQLRNSYFYLGDCAFDLKDDELAIRHYDAAKERYPKDPASLVAMIQIVNAHVRQGDMKRAAAANERAKRFFDSLPDSVWDDPNLPMSRKDWERWLGSTVELARPGGSAPATASAPGAEGPN
ncbi:MAG: tetratricopeptide repeat protein [Phycisphaerales bacterium]|nr:tetratricopeptide repeat protein [Phycisphaerales bacterium]